VNLNGGFIAFLKISFPSNPQTVNRMVHEAAQPRSKQHVAMKAAKARREELHKHQQQATPSSTTPEDGAASAAVS